MKEFRSAKKRIEVSVGESVRIIREFQDLSQNQLAELTGIPQATISAIENGRVNLGAERTKVRARLKVPSCGSSFSRLGCSAGVSGITIRATSRRFARQDDANSAIRPRSRLS